MIKKIDGYVLKTFLGPFIFIFSVLFFIFVVNIAWINLDRIAGKGLSYFQVLKFLFYMGVQVVQMVLPLTILLASIMTFGSFGERYELAAMKASGVSLARVMAPLFILVCIMSIGLFLFSNTVIPENQRKVRNMLYNITKTQPSLSFVEGRFITELPKYTILIDKKYGENESQLENVIVYETGGYQNDKNTIVAERGQIKNAKDPHFIKFDLYTGYVYQIDGKQFNAERGKVKTQRIKFDTLTLHFDISEILQKALDQENIKEHYRYNDYSESTVFANKEDSLNKVQFNVINNQYVSRIMSTASLYDTIPTQTNKPIQEPIDFKSLSEDEKYKAISMALANINLDQNDWETQNQEITDRIKNYNKILMYQQQIITYSITCIIFFLIGAPLGAIIRKGGLGMPVVVAIVIFIIFFILTNTMINQSKRNFLDPVWAAWLPNIILFPLGIYLSYQSMRDSEIFNIDNYLTPIRKFFNKFGNKKKEHSRYA